MADMVKSRQQGSFSGVVAAISRLVINEGTTAEDVFLNVAEKRAFRCFGNSTEFGNGTIVRRHR